MLAFMASVVIHDQLAKEIPALQRTPQELWDTCAGLRSSATTHLGLMARDNGCKYAIAVPTITLLMLRGLRERKN